MKSIAVVLGTSRINGNTHTLAKVCCEQLDADFFDLAQFNISMFDYQHKNQSDDFLKLIKKLVNYKQIIFASPVYWYSPSAKLKVFLDRFSDLLTIEKDLGRQLRGKKVSVIATGADSKEPDCFTEIFVRTSDYLGMKYCQILYCCCPSDINIEQHKSGIEKFVTSVD
ncbi:flavodoxin family protein [Aliikangiella sp. IMCC44359]|uniref:flavodoxin family protein n=1 Tax=Aliikangiella sp. IMCC44359 TaxID=3459125 RepID=UPI00403B16BC